MIARKILFLEKTLRIIAINKYHKNLIVKYKYYFMKLTKNQKSVEKLQLNLINFRIFQWQYIFC